MYLNYNIDTVNVKNKNILNLLKSLLEDYKNKSELFNTLINEKQVILENIFKIIFYNMINNYILKGYSIFYYRSHKTIQIRKLLTYTKNHKYLVKQYNVDIIDYLYNNNYITLYSHNAFIGRLSSFKLNQTIIDKFKELNIEDLIYNEDSREYTKQDRLLDDRIQIRKQKNFKKRSLKVAASKKIKKLITPKNFDRQSHINKVMKMNNISSLSLLDKKINILKDKLNIINTFIDTCNFKIVNYDIHKSKLKSNSKLRLDNININLSNTNDPDIKILPHFFFKQKRIFNNWSFIQGGRLYSRFQFINKEARNDILINNQKTSSIDLKNSHTRLLYHLSDHNISTNIDLYLECNPYNFPKNISRKLNKFILMLLINSKRITSKRSLENIEKEMLSYKINYDDYFYKDIPFHDYIKHLIQQIFNSHTDIQMYFNTKVGLLLQFIESEILIDSIIDLIKNHNILALPIHDELIVQSEYKEITQEYIKKHYNLYVHQAIEKNYYKRFINQFERIKNINKRSIDIPKIILKDKNIIFKPSIE